MSKAISKHHTRKRVTFPYEIVIPSYNRPETLRNKTLTILKAYRIPAEKITVFVADKEQEKLYKGGLKPGTYGKIVVGSMARGGIYNFISGYYPIGTPIVNINDDSKGFLEYDADMPHKEKPLKSLLAVIKRGFAECEKAEARLWGVYPVANGLFMKPKVSTDLKYICGSFWGCINPGVKEIKTTLEYKEDYERSILYYKADGTIVRLNMVAPIPSYSKEEHSKQRIEKSAQWLVKEFPEFAVLNPSKKSGTMEVRLRDMRENKGDVKEDK